MDEYAGQRIRKLRETKQYTRETLAEMADISSKFLYEIETGKKQFSADVLCRIAQSLGVSCDCIMFGKDESVQINDQQLNLLVKLNYRDIAIAQELLKNIIELNKIG